MTIQSRRQFLGTSAGLMIGMALPLKGRAQEDPKVPTATPTTDPMAPGTFAPNAFVRVAPDNSVTVMIKHIEFGQGPYTGLSTLVAEEMDADWSQMRAESSPVDDTIYANLFFGIQGTGGSSSIANSWTQMRKAGAAARAMLVAAAAEQWGVPADEITVSKGTLTHAASDQTASFGDLAEAAANQTMPEDPPLKDPSQYTLIGSDRPKLDTPAKVNGSATYTLDVYRPGMQTVVVKHPTVIGATVASFDASAAEKVPGVQAVREIPQGVAVYASNTFAALKGREALLVEWDTSNAETRSSARIFDDFAEAARQGGQVVEQAGDAETGIANAATAHEVEFRFPYLAHAPMEPLDAVIEVKAGKAEAWMGAQFPGGDKQAIADGLDLSPDDVTLNVMLAGGSFGRRAQTIPQIGMEIAAIARAAGGDGAWKLVWTREDDLTGGFYRPITLHRMRGGLDADGNIVGWTDTVVNASIMEGSPMDPGAKPDSTSFEGSTKMPYDLPDLTVDWVKMQSPMTVLWWRSVGHTHTGYATEVFLDELLEKAGRDPVQGRLDLMKDEAGRDRAVLEKVAEIAGWDGQKVKDGRGYGVAVHESFNTYVAQIVEVEDHDGLPRVTRVWAAVDCGVAVNPNLIRAQIEGGVGFGLGSILYDEITLLDGGEIAQKNFDTYRMLRIHEMPQVEVAILDSDADPTGVGEPGTPPIGPAVANAWRALTGRAVHTLPFAKIEAGA